MRGVNIIKKNIHLDNFNRRINIDRIEKYRDIYFKRIKINFNNIEQEAEQYAEETYNKLISSEKKINYDSSILAEFANGDGIGYYRDLSIAKYNVLAMFISTLYQIWEQQIRRFLYDSITFEYKTEFKDFCVSSKEIKQLLEKYNLNLVKLKSFKKLNELRLLVNVIKHGEGDSSEKLKEINSNLFRREENIDELEINIMNTTLLNETLDINDNDFYKYTDAVINFWREFPEKLCIDNKDYDK